MLVKVFVGRPIIYGLAVGGTKGATRVLEILRDELDLTMALAGDFLQMQQAQHIYIILLNSLQGLRIWIS